MQFPKKVIYLFKFSTLKVISFLFNTEESEVLLFLTFACILSQLGCKLLISNLISRCTDTTSIDCYIKYVAKIHCKFILASYKGKNNYFLNKYVRKHVRDMIKNI